MSCTVTRNGNPVAIARHRAPHLTAEGTWHGEFDLPALPVPERTPEQWNKPPPAEPSVAQQWLGAVLSVECDEVKVPAAQVVCVRGYTLEWEGRAG